MSGDSDAVSAQFAEILAQMKKLDTIEAKLQNLEVAQHTQQLAITRFKSGQAVTAMADASLGVPRAPPLASPNDCLLATTSWIFQNSLHFWLLIFFIFKTSILSA